MKKKVFLPIVLLLVAFNLAYPQLSVGIHGGPTFGNGKYVMKTDFLDPSTNIIYRKFFDYEKDGANKTSFSFGGIIETRMYSFLYLQSEVNFTDHRFSLEKNSRLFFGFDITGGPYTMNYSFKYIEMPIILKTKFKFDNFLPFAFVGAGIGLLYKSIESINSWDNSISETTKYEQPFALIGIGTEYSLNNFLNLFLTFRYSNTLVDIAKSEFVYFKPHNYDLLLGIKTKLLNY
jgi:hypothetical protein